MEQTAFYGRWACQKMIESASSNLWDGHWACAVLSMARLLDEQLVPAGLEHLVRRNLDQIVTEKGNQGVYDDAERKDGFRRELLRLLIRNGGKINSLGHDAIYASYMLDLVERSGIPATQELFDAMATMLQGFADSGPGYVTINGIHTVVPPGEVPEAENEPGLAPASVLELFHAFSRPERMERGDMQLGHLLTHGHAVVELKRALRAEALEEHAPILEQSFFNRVGLLAYANALEKEEAEPAAKVGAGTRNPLEPSYWEEALADSRHGHYGKYAYSYLRLCRLAGIHPADFQSFSRILPPLA
ncbi:hypothetical protein HGI30_00835 [Paenibacillus albicereus]|uniref:Uncharacterized protein n=1 Tax=Paenibacillus albicereus TaxID=2726185 RepID=A0A6H2GT13_9BACL|nr:hypothetical protein [Paenibacillus albicereus]QJC50288.1 hypothetical protein HGI30_00835 [Paenibacillus albicereus]